MRSQLQVFRPCSSSICKAHCSPHCFSRSPSMCQHYRKQYEPSIQCDTSPLLTRSQQSIRESHVTVKKEACPRCTQSDNYCPLSCCNTKYECKVWLTGVLCQCSQIYRIWPIQSVNLYLPLSTLLPEFLFGGEQIFQKNNSIQMFSISNVRNVAVICTDTDSQ